MRKESLVSAIFFREQFPYLKAEMMKRKAHDIKVVAMNGSDECSTNALNAICKLS